MREEEHPGTRSDDAADGQEPFGLEPLRRWVERLASDTPQRRAMMEGFDLTWHRLQTGVPPGEAAAGIVLEMVDKKRPG